ncbi:DnaB-like helicase N-terminal domain-containing protein, partial [Klebsiella pneumoniae]
MKDIKAPPHSIEAEQAVLGGLMLDNQRWEEVADVITPHDFYTRQHRIIWSALAS